jgi:hypothetical protein
VSVHRPLAIVLAVQVVLIAIAWWPSDPAANRRRPAIGVERERIQQIEIALRPVDDADPEPAILARTDGGWTVLSAAAYPAKEAQVDELLDKLLGLTTGAPIATSSASHEALKVSEDDYGRRIKIVTGDEPVEWLVGSATNNSVNLRKVGEDDVYRATGSGEWSFRDSSASYYDPNYLDADAGSFAAVVVRNESGEVRFEQADGVWRLADLAEGEQSDPEKITGFLAAVAKLRMSQPEGPNVSPEHGFDSGSHIEWTVASDDQSISGGYAVGAEVEGDRYVKAEGHPFVVRARKSAVQRLLDANRAEFLRQEG